MKSIFVLSLALLSSTVFAESATFNVKGMHCGACAKSIEDKVCTMDGVKSCKAEVTNAKKKTGKITITTEDGKPISSELVSELVSSAGDYKVETPKGK